MASISEPSRMRMEISPFGPQRSNRERHRLRPGQPSRIWISRVRPCATLRLKARLTGLVADKMSYRNSPARMAEFSPKSTPTRGSAADLGVRPTKPPNPHHFQAAHLQAPVPSLHTCSLLHSLLIASKIR